MSQNFPATLRVADRSQLTGSEKLEGPQGQEDPATYQVWQKQEDGSGPAARYLVDAGGVPKYLVDPEYAARHGYGAAEGNPGEATGA